MTLVARGAHPDALRERGLTLRTPDRDVTGRLPAVAGPDGPPLPADTVLVLTVKSQDTVAALDVWADAPVEGGGTAGERLPVVLAQNGVANEPAALRRFARVHPVCVWLPATTWSRAWWSPTAIRIRACCTSAATRAAPTTPAARSPPT
ncbi:2-dehydropantoate 2-reductase N-terminal domain-containing protein [Micromonospora sp. BRA006-A]|nr:2-dehydropantoate 2-reductase N-terminal domain-containing protein [Micromonospora sp. BRA006-A]